MRQNTLLYQVFNESYSSDYLLIETNHSIILYGNKVNDKNQSVVLKFIKNTEVSQQQINTELEIMEKLNHTNLLKCIDFFFYCNRIFTCVVTEYTPYGTLQDVIDDYYRRTGKGVPLNLFKEIMFQLSHAINHLHQHGYVHRNINPKNILIFDWPFFNKSNAKIKISLSGFSLSARYNEKDKLKDNAGELDFIAPEVYFGYGYTPQADIWSFGILLILTLTGRSPLPNSKYAHQQFQDCLKIGDINFKLLEGFPFELVEIIQKMFDLNINERISAGDILKKPFLSDLLSQHLPDSLKHPTAVQKHVPESEKLIMNELNVNFDSNYY